MKKIGIVIPVYNVEQYLSKCVESIINQTYKNWELVLVDDGSTDMSGQLCDMYAAKDSRIRVIHQKNAGPLAARYMGMKELQCDYATFVDSDDWIDIYTYSKMAQYMEQDIDVITYNITRYYSEANMVRSVNEIPAGLYKEDNLIKKVFPYMLWDVAHHVAGIDAALWNKLMKYDLLMESLEKAQILHFQYGEDVAVIYPLIARAKSLYISEEYLCFHRQREVGNIPNYIKTDSYLDHLFLLYKYLRKELPDTEVFVKQIEYFYLHALEVRLRIYGDKKTRKDYIFPFNLVPSGKKLVLYGAGAVGQNYFEQVKKINYGEIVCWVDKNFAAYKNFPVEQIEVITEKEFDYVIIAIKSENTATEIKETLISLGVKENSIIWSVR